MRYKQRVAEAKGREDAAHEAELKHRQEQDARLKRATELPADGAAFAGMREREEEAARRRKQRLDKVHAEAEQQRQQKEEQERAKGGAGATRLVRCLPRAASSAARAGWATATSRPCRWA
jgi:hypothetical protein